jgi:mono/diheme cytochrome c family protein
MKPLPFIFLIMLLAFSACTEEATPKKSTGDAERGETLFNTGLNGGVPCSGCHTLTGIDTVGPSLQGLGERAGQHDMPANDFIRESILNPGAVRTPGFNDWMPKNYPDLLTDQDIEDLTAFLLQQ